MQHGLLASGDGAKGLKSSTSSWHRGTGPAESGGGTRRQSADGAGEAEAAGGGSDSERLNKNSRFLSSTAEQWQRGSAAGLRLWDLAEG